MAIIRPFKAIRAPRDKAHLVATRTISNYKNNILRAKLESNPYSFIHIIYPDFFSKQKTDPNSKERHRHIRKVFDEFMENKTLIQEERSTLYIYRQTHGENSFYGVIGLASIDEYRKGLIKKHEATLTSREEQFTNYLQDVEFNAEPVLLSYPSDEKLDEIYVMAMQNRSEYEFTTSDTIKHELWVLSPEETNVIRALFNNVEATYIADGHHRTASSEKLSSLIGDENPKSNYFMAFFIDETYLKIWEFNRLVKKIGMASDEFLRRAATFFDITKVDTFTYPKFQHEMMVNLRGQWYLFLCKAGIIDVSNPVKSLDTDILTQFLLTPILGIKDLKTDDNIRFISGNLGCQAIDKAIVKKEAELGIVLHPLTIEQVKDVADNEMIMPPKSTWIEPKLRTGLTIYSIKEE